MDNVFYSSKSSLYNKMPGMLSELSQTSKRLLKKPSPKPLERDHTLNVMLIQSLRRSSSRRREDIELSADEKENKLKVMRRAYTVAGDRMRDGAGSSFYGYRRYKQSQPSSGLPLPKLYDNHYQIAMNTFMEKYDTSNIKPFKDTPSLIQNLEENNATTNSTAPEAAAKDIQHKSGYVYSEQLRMLQQRKQQGHTEYRLPKYKTISPSDSSASSMTSSCRASRLSINSPPIGTLAKPTQETTYKRPDIIIPCHTNVECKYCGLYDDESDHECSKNSDGEKELSYGKHKQGFKMIEQKVTQDNSAQRKSSSYSKHTNKAKKRLENTNTEECADKSNIIPIVAGDDDMATVSPHPIMQLTQSFTLSNRAHRLKSVSSKEQTITSDCSGHVNSSKDQELQEVTSKSNDSQLRDNKVDPTAPDLPQPNLPPSSSTSSADPSTPSQDQLTGILKPTYRLYYSKTECAKSSSTVTFAQ